jgi:hypothetical protein
MRHMPPRHLVCCPNVEALQPCQHRLAQHPRLTAIEQHRLDYRLVKQSANLRGCILHPEHVPNSPLGGAGSVILGPYRLNIVVVLRVPNSPPGGAGSANLGPYRLNIVVVLQEKMPKVLENVDPLENLIMDCELLV